MTEEINLTQTFDARAWAKEWLKTIKANPAIPTDESTMIEWFANAIMAGYDHAQREERNSPDGKIDQKSYLFGYKKGISDQQKFSRLVGQTLSEDGRGYYPD